MSKSTALNNMTDKAAPTMEVDKKINSVEKNIDTLVGNALTALKEFRNFDQEQIDTIVQAMTTAGVGKHMYLSKFAVEETKRGIVEDKVIKNIFATEYVNNGLRGVKSVGVINEREYDDIVEIAEPIGVVAAVTPVTNPTSTTMFKILIAIKARNPIIFGFHPAAQQCSAAAAKIMYDAAIAAGAPKNCIQWIDEPSIEATAALMNHDGVALVLATGGSAMVNAAYSTGKPALGVGPGNVPCYIHKSAQLPRAVHDLVLSKSFDNGMICASEQAVIVDKEIADEFEKRMINCGCYFSSPAETKKLSDYVIKPNGMVNADVVGQYPVDIAEKAGFKVPKDTKIIVAKIEGVGPEYPLSHEKLSPVLAMLVADSEAKALDYAEAMLHQGGVGHTAVLHAEDKTVIDDFSNRMEAGRILVNCPSSQGAIGDIYNALIPSLTLGCGSYGHNSTTDNVFVKNLVNVKRVATRRNNMQWFKVPPKIFFEYESTQYLAKMGDISRVFIVTDPSMVQFHYVDKVLHYLGLRDTPVDTYIFSDVEPDPSLDTINAGVKAMNAFKPDCIIALGGGSAMDAAKGMWLFYEAPDVEFEPLTYKFLDIRKRAVKFPEIGRKAKMVCIPTTSGTGSEVTSFAVITDKSTNTKYPLADYELTPDVAIIDPSYVVSLPKALSADTGMDVLTHAIESYVSIMANDYTDGLSIQACKLVMSNLQDVYKNPGDRNARMAMHNASCIAGMSFTNAFLGINHSLAHKLGGEFHIPHGRANAILLPHVIAYNAAQASKYAVFPKYEDYIADRRYAEIAFACGLKASTTEEGVKSLIDQIRKMMKEMNMPLSVKECGIDKKTYMDAVDMLAEKAFEDQCTTANPRLPMISELKQLLIDIYE